MKKCETKVQKVAKGVYLVAVGQGRGKRPKTFFKLSKGAAKQLAARLRKGCVR